MMEDKMNEQLSEDWFQELKEEIKKRQAESTDKLATEFQNLFNDKNEDHEKKLKKQISQLLEIIRQLKQKREDDAVRIKAETRAEVFGEIDAAMHESMITVGVGGMADISDILRTLLMLFGRIPEMRTLVGNYVAECQQQNKQQGIGVSGNNQVIVAPNLTSINNENR